MCDLNFVESQEQGCTRIQKRKEYSSRLRILEDPDDGVKITITYNMTIDKDESLDLGGFRKKSSSFDLEKNVGDRGKNPSIGTPKKKWKSEFITGQVGGILEEAGEFEGSRNGTRDDFRLADYQQRLSNASRGMLGSIIKTDTKKVGGLEEALLRGEDSNISEKK